MVFKKKKLDWAIFGGATIIPLSQKTKGNKKNFQDKPNLLFLSNSILLKVVFP
jgi:hypothetical protein